MVLAGLGGGEMARAQVGLGLAPMRVELRMASGAQRSGSVSVSNDSPGPIRVRAQLLDFFIDSDGTPQFAPVWPAEAGGSCRGWLTLNPMETELKPGEQAQVRYTLRMPAGEQPGSYHCAAGFTTLPTADAAQATGLRMAVRVVAAFYAIEGSPAVEGSVKEMRLEETHEGDRPGWRGVVTIENRGSMYFRAAGELSVLHPDGQVVESAPFIGIPILPKREQRFLFRFQTPLAPGPYLLRSRVDIGANEIQEVVLPVVVEPPKP
jgi:hypothetical protein